MVLHSPRLVAESDSHDFVIPGRYGMWRESCQRSTELSVPGLGTDSWGNEKGTEDLSQVVLKVYMTLHNKEVSAFGRSVCHWVEH